MMSLFNSFDFMIFGSKFFISIFFLIYFLVMIFFNNTMFLVLKKELSEVFFSMIFLIKSKKVSKFLSLICVCFFILNLIFNLSSIFPFTFSFTTQMSIVFLSALMVWLSFLLFSLLKNWKSVVSHKVPEGSPLLLSVILFLIEVVSELIRPLTLSLRLVGNMVVGHVLLMLTYKLVNFLFFFSPLFLVLNSVEILVCFIQSYIFFTLVVMYCSEM